MPEVVLLSKKNMKRIVVLIAIIINFNFCLFAQDTSTYLAKNNCAIIANNEDTSALFLFSDDVLRNQIFAVGEIHDFKGNAEIYKALFFALNKRGVKHIVIELPLGMNDIIITYLKTGNAAILGKPFNKYFSDWAAFLSWVYNYNKTKAENQKITIDCIDTDVNYEFGACVKSLQKLLPDERVEIPIEIKDIILKIKSFNKEQMIKTIIRKHKIYYKNIAYALYESMQHYDHIYRNYFKDNYLEFKKRTDGFYLGNLLSSYFDLTDMRREKFMYSNYLDIINKYRNEKLFCIHGTAHISTLTNENLKRYNDYINTTVMTMLNTNPESPVKEKICAIPIEYIKISDRENVPIFIKKSPFLQYSKTPLTFFKLNGTNTPFDEKSIGGIQYLIINGYK